MPKKKNETKEVAYFIASKAMIKFVGDEDPIAIADNVMDVSDFDKYPILKGDTVEVGVKDDEVTFLRKVKGASKKKKEEKSESTSSDEISKTITKEVYCVSKYGLKFVGDKQWTNFSDELQKKDLKSMGVVAKNTITVSLNEDEKIVKVGTVEKKNEGTSSTSKKTSYRDEESTDKRTASMNAKDVVVALLNNGTLEKNNIKSCIKDLTETFYSVTKNL